MKHLSRIERAAVATVSLVVGIAGAVMVAGPAEAAAKETNYGFYAYAFGTDATAQQVGLSSGRTAFSLVACTRLAGKVDTRTLDAADAPANNPNLGIGAVSSKTETFKRGGDVGSESTNKIDNLALGASDGPHLIIKGLETTATAWANRGGRFHTSESFKLTDIISQTGQPEVDDELNQSDISIEDLFDVIRAQPNSSLLIPGVGRITLGGKAQTISSTLATSDAVALNVLLFGENQVQGGGDDVSVVIGHSHARVYSSVKAGVMDGHGYAADVNALDGSVGVDQLARQALDCDGTSGRVLENSAAGLSLGNADALSIGASSGRAFGEQHKKNSARAWTEGRVANLDLGNGQLVLDGRGRAGQHRHDQGRQRLAERGRHRSRLDDRERRGARAPRSGRGARDSRARNDPVRSR